MKKRYDVILISSVILLSIIGIIMILSSSYIWANYKFNDPFKYIKSQMIFFILGIFIMFLLRKFDYRILYKK